MIVNGLQTMDAALKVHISPPPTPLTSNFQFLHNPLLNALKTRWSVSVYHAGSCRVLLYGLPAFSIRVKATDEHDKIIFPVSVV